MKRILLVLTIALNAKNIPLVYRNNDWATHQPVLCELAKQTNGPIIEFGCGDSSTLILHELCKKNNRMLISLDDDKKWIKKCSAQFLGDGYEKDNSGWHKFFFVPGKPLNPDPDDPDINGEYWTEFIRKTKIVRDTNFSICFIDQWPWRGRVETLNFFKNKARFIVLHDCDFFVPKHFGHWVRKTNHSTGSPGKMDWSDTFKYFKVYFPAKPWPALTGPPTLIGSNFTNSFPDIDYQSYPNELDCE